MSGSRLAAAAKPMPMGSAGPRPRCGEATSQAAAPRATCEPAIIGAESFAGWTTSDDAAHGRGVEHSAKRVLGTAGKSAPRALTNAWKVIAKTGSGHTSTAESVPTDQKRRAVLC